MDRQQHPTHNTQHATRNTQHATRNTQHATRNTQHATRNTQHATRNTQHATRNTQHATRNTQHATLDTQHATQASTTTMTTKDKYNSFQTSYLDAALWSSTVSLPVDESDLIDGCMDVDDEHPLHGISESEQLDSCGFTIYDFDDDSRQLIIADCDKFEALMLESGLGELAAEFADDDTIAHDFWLTRCGHGTGFWDGDYDDDDDPTLGDRITKLVNDNFGECHIYINDGGESLSMF